MNQICWGSISFFNCCLIFLSKKICNSFKISINGHLGFLKFFTNTNNVTKNNLEQLFLQTQASVSEVYSLPGEIRPKASELFNSDNYSQMSLFEDSNNLSSSQHCVRILVFSHTTNTECFLSLKCHYLI